MPINDYAAAADIQAVLSNLDLSGTAANGQTYTSILTTLITRASRAIDKYTGRKPGAYYASADVTRYYDGPGYGLYNFAEGGYFDDRLHSGVSHYASLWIDELAAPPTQVAVAETGNVANYNPWPSTDYFLWPYNAPDDGLPYLRLDLDILYGSHRTWLGFRRAVQVIGKFGYATTVPDDINQAVITFAARLYKRGQLSYSDKIAYIDQTTAVAYLNHQDSDIAETIQHYRRMAI